jgi:hypothetical protein
LFPGKDKLMTLRIADWISSAFEPEACLATGSVHQHSYWQAQQNQIEAVVAPCLQA